MFCRRNKRASLASRDAFTLIEVMVASSIMLIAILAVVSAFSYSRATESRAENRLACLHIAREVMENLRMENYAATALSIGNKKTLPGYPKTRGYYNVALCADNRFPNTKDITVVIEWVEPGGMKQSVSLTTSHSRGLHR